MDVDKEQLKQVVSRLIEEERWSEAVRLLDAIESSARNQSVVRKAFDDASNIVSNGECGV